MSSVNCPFLLVREKSLIMWFPGSKYWVFLTHSWVSKSKNLALQAAMEACFSEY